MSILEQSNYRTFLKTFLAEKASTNPSYSLRAMALKLKIVPSHLSAVLKGKKNLSAETALQIAARLGLQGKDAEYFCLLVQIEGTKSPSLKQALLQRAQSLSPNHSIHDLSVDHFRIISDWHHFAIMAATELDGFSATSIQLSRALGIALAETELALERLERLEMIEKDGRGIYRKIQGNPRVVSHAPNQALRNYHHQTLQKAIESLEHQSPKEKVIGSETLCIDSRQIDEYRELVEEFFSKALALSKKAKKKDQVYHLGVQFFNLTHSKKKKEKSNA